MINAHQSRTSSAASAIRSCFCGSRRHRLNPLSRRVLFGAALGLVLLVTSPSLASDTPGSILENAIQGTVTVQLWYSDDSMLWVSAAGIVVARDDDTAYVVIPDFLQNMQSSLRGGTLEVPQTARVICFPGTNREHAVEGDVVDVDQEAGLTVIAIQGENLPDPVQLEPELALQPGQQYYAVGMPFESALNRLHTSSPTPTAKRVRFIDSKKRYQQAPHLVFHGFVPEGYVGGPVADSDGSVVAMIYGTSGAEPVVVAHLPSTVESALAPRVSRLTCSSARRTDSGKAALTISALLHDPLGQIRSLQALVSTGDLIPRPGRDEDGRNRPLQPTLGYSDMKTVASVENSGLKAIGEVEVELPEDTAITVAYQIEYFLSNGRALYSETSSRTFQPRRR